MEYTIKEAAVIKEFATSENELYALTEKLSSINFYKIAMQTPSGVISISKEEAKRIFSGLYVENRIFADRSKERLCRLLEKKNTMIKEIAQPDEEMQLAAVKGGAWILNSISSPANETIVKALVNTDYAATHMGYGRQDNESFRLLNMDDVKRVIQENPAAMSAVPSDMMTAELVYVFLEAMIKQNKDYLYGAFHNIPEAYRNKMFWQCLCMVNGYNYSGIPSDKREEYVSEKLIHYTLDHENSYVGAVWMYQYIPEKFKTKNISIRCILSHPGCIRYLPKKFRNDDFYAELIQADAEYKHSFAWMQYMDISTISRKLFVETVERYHISNLPEKIPVSYITDDFASIMAENRDAQIPKSAMTEKFYDEMARKGILGKLPQNKLNADRVEALIESGNSRVYGWLPDEYKTPEILQSLRERKQYQAKDVAAFPSEEMVIQAICDGIVTRFDEIPESFRNESTLLALAQSDTRYSDIPEEYQTEEICTEILSHKDKNSYEWMYALLHCAYPPQEAIEEALGKWESAIEIRGLTREQIAKSIENFPLNILKAPEWYFVDEEDGKNTVETVKATVEAVESTVMPKKHTEINYDDCKQVSIFDLLGI